MRSTPSFSRRWLLLLAILSPALLGAQFKCVAVSNPSLATARIDQLQPTALRVGEVVQVTASGTGDPPLQFAWDFGDGDAPAFGAQAAHVYTTPGSYRITLTVHDAMNHAAHDSAQVSVSPRVAGLMPTVVMISDAIANQPVEFLALSIGAHGDELSQANPSNSKQTSGLSYDWTFSNGQSGMGPHAVAIFPSAGTYVASVSVTNEAGAVTTAQIVFEVAAVPQ